MARGITEAEVFEAADQLLIRGQRPTIERVRQELGTGSPNTVNRHLDAWWTSLSKRMGGQSAVTLPESLLNLCQRLYVGIGDEVAREASAEANALRESVERERLTLEQAREGLAQEKQSVSTLMEILRKDLAVASAQNAESAGRIASLEAALKTEQGRSISAERRLQAATDEAVRIQKTAEHQVERVRTQWEGNERRWLTEIDQLRTAAKQATVDREKEVRRARSHIETLAKDQALKDAEFRSLQNELKQALAQVIREREGRIAAEAELVGLRRGTDQKAGKSVRSQAPSVKKAAARRRSG